MPINKRPVAAAAKPAASAPTPKGSAAPETSEDVTVIGRTVTITRGLSVAVGESQWAKISVGITGPRDEVDDIREDVKVLALEEIASAVEQIQEYAFPEAEAEADAEGSAEAPEGEGEEGEITAETVREMSREEIVTLLKENDGIEVDLAAFKKTAAGLSELREAVITAAGLEEADATDGDADAEGEGVISEDEINAMDRVTLVTLIKDNSIEVDPKKFPKLAELKTAVIEAIAAADGADGEAEGGDESYTAESLGGMSIPDLKEIYTEWGLGTFPVGPPPAAKKKAIEAILKAQAG